MMISLFTDDACANIVSEHVELQGYELYIVEQWACSRDHLTSLITTFSGLPRHKLIVAVVDVPAEQSQWTARLRTYVQAMCKPYTRPNETPFGVLQVTDLGEFPSNLTVINVPNGDFWKCQSLFILNENLKRMRCLGRTGLCLSPPNHTTQGKFRQLYCVNDRVPIQDAVIELVRLCQIALVIFKQLAREYTDGFLCDVTATALQQWWARIGTDFFNLEPSEGILGPSTVSGLLGLLLGARNRLNICNTPVGKDVFDLKATKKSIEQFQKLNKLQRTRRLDRRTFYRLHRNTSKTINNDGWAVPRAVKSTVVELGGKGGEMVMDIVGNRDRTNPSDVETLDIQTFARAVSGDHCKWLWHGKSRKGSAMRLNDMFTSEEDSNDSELEKSGTNPYSERLTPMDLRSRLSVVDVEPHNGEEEDLDSHPSLTVSDKEQLLRKSVLKNVTGRKNETKTGLGRFRDEVAIAGLRSQPSMSSKDHDTALRSDFADKSDLDTTIQSVSITANSDEGNKDKGAWAGLQADSEATGMHLSHVTPTSTEDLAPSISSSHGAVGDGPGYESNQVPRTGKVASQSSASLNDHASPECAILTTLGSEQELQQIGRFKLVSRKVFRLRSLNSLNIGRGQTEGQQLRISRHMSTDLLRDLDLVATNPLMVVDRALAPKRSRSHLYGEEAISLAFASSQLNRLTDAQIPDAARLERNFDILQHNDDEMHKELGQVSNERLQLLEHYNGSMQLQADLVTGAKASFTDHVSKIEGHVAKLEYEIGGLNTKVEDLEGGLAEYEHQISALEEKMRTLVVQHQAASSFARKIFGAPIVTR